MNNVALGAGESAPYLLQHMPDGSLRVVGQCGPVRPSQALYSDELGQDGVEAAARYRDSNLEGTGAFFGAYGSRPGAVDDVPRHVAPAMMNKLQPLQPGLARCVSLARSPGVHDRGASLSRQASLPRSSSLTRQPALARSASLARHPALPRSASVVRQQALPRSVSLARGVPRSSSGAGAGGGAPANMGAFASALLRVDSSRASRHTADTGAPGFFSQLRAAPKGRQAQQDDADNFKLHGRSPRWTDDLEVSGARDTSPSHHPAALGASASPGPASQKSATAVLTGHLAQPALADTVAARSVLNEAASGFDYASGVWAAASQSRDVPAPSSGGLPRRHVGQQLSGVFMGPPQPAPPAYHHQNSGHSRPANSGLGSVPESTLAMDNLEPTPVASTTLAGVGASSDNARGGLLRRSGQLQQVAKFATAARDLARKVSGMSRPSLSWKGCQPATRQPCSLLMFPFRDCRHRCLSWRILTMRTTGPTHRSAARAWSGTV
jgi:hypothetical protein